MANDIKWETPTVALTSYLTTSLNSLADNVIDIGAAIDNETNLCTFMDLSLTLASLDLSAVVNPSITVYLFEAIDGGTLYDTNEDGISAVTDIPTADKICAIMGLRVDTGAEAKHAVKSMIPIPPGNFKLGLRNTTGVAFGATLNLLKYRTYNLSVV